MINKQTVELIERLMDEKNVSKEQLANVSGVPLATIKRILSRQTENPYFDTMVSLVTALGGSLDEIMYGEESTAVKTKSRLTRELLDAIHETADQSKRLDEFRAACEQRIHDRDRLLATRDKWIRHLSIFAVAETAVVILVWILDFLMPNVGWIRQLVQSLSSLV